MSISGLFMGTRALAANQIALEVTGQNISNVNTPGYTRQRAHLATTESFSKPWGVQGSGVKVADIQRVRDAFIDLEIRGQSSSVGKDGVEADFYDRIESIFNDPSNASLDSLLGNFFAAMNDFANDPESLGTRDSLLLQAETLANQIKFVNGELDQLRLNVDSAVVDTVTEINSLTSQIADLNREIVKMEAGNLHNANDLRDKREEFVKDLATIADITTNEQDTGEINISIGGLNVVFGSVATSLATEIKTGDELPVHKVVVEGAGGEVTFTSGEMAGYLATRDTNIVTQTTKLDALARGLIDQINKVHVGGRGIAGYSSATSVNAVNDTTATLDDAGLAITPVDTTFQIKVYDSSADSETSVDVVVDVSADSLEDVRDAINTALTNAGVTNVTASIDSDSKLVIASSDSDETFTFGNSTDSTSNFLSAIGLNTFFTGSTAGDIDVNQTLVSSPNLVAGATTSATGDNSNALAMADLRQTELLDSNTRTFEEYYQNTIVSLANATQQAKIAEQASQGYLTQLDLKRESISGVSLDEEAANLIIYQRAYEAAARYINVIDSLLNTLVNGLV